MSIITSSPEAFSLSTRCDLVVTSLHGKRKILSSTSRLVQFNLKIKYKRVYLITLSTTMLHCESPKVVSLDRAVDCLCNRKATDPAA